MKEFDNIKIADLPILLNENSTLKRFYPLIPKCSLIMKLRDFGIDDKYSFLYKMSSSAEALSVETGLDLDTLYNLEGLFHLHDYINRRLNKLETINPSLISALQDDNIKKSSDYLKLCMNNSADELSHKYKCDAAEIIHLFCLCDLARLPGVKELRASLYYDSGFKTLQSFADNETEDMQNKIAEFINSTGSKKSVPLKKELSTQIAVAKILPIIKFKSN